VSAHRQRGAVLLVALCVMLVLMLLGASAARNAINAEKSARGERDRQIALQAAEAALLDAERDIESNGVSARARMFAPGSVAGFVDGCGTRADNLGLCKRAPAHAAPAWQRARLTERGVVYGRFTGAMMPVGHASLPARAPRYVIELMPYERAGEDAGQRTGNFYRITAIGFGASETTRIVLQSYYLKAMPEGATP
jgi:Tfp pilus assembly protein PilX